MGRLDQRNGALSLRGSTADLNLEFRRMTELTRLAEEGVRARQRAPVAGDRADRKALVIVADVAGIGLRQAVLATGLLSEVEYDALVDPEKMV